MQFPIFITFLGVLFYWYQLSGVSAWSVCYTAQNALTISGLNIERIDCFYSVPYIVRGMTFEWALSCQVRNYTATGTNNIFQEFAADKESLCPSTITFYAGGYSIQVDLLAPKELAFCLTVRTPIGEEAPQAHSWKLYAKDVDELLAGAFSCVCSVATYIRKGNLLPLVQKLDCISQKLF